MLQAWPARGGCACHVPPPLLLARGVHALLGLGGPYIVLGPAKRWGPVLPCSGFPPCPRFWVGGPALPSLP